MVLGKPAEDGESPVLRAFAVLKEFLQKTKKVVDKEVSP